MVHAKVLLDTDIGSDVDDAFCLAYLLAQPRCDLLGVTTVTGEAEERAKMASALCRMAGQDIPVFPGKEEPLHISQVQKTAPQARALEKWDHAEEFPKGRAVEFLAETIRENPREITLLTIGPLTNIGYLFEENPDIAGLLKGLVMMCGTYREGHPSGGREWNFSGDPHATAIVFGSDARLIRAVGLNVTTRLKMGSEEVRERFRSPLMEPVLDFAEIWFEGNDGVTFHDPLAATTIFDEGICAFTRGRVGVELEKKDLMGTTYWCPGGDDAPHEVAVEVDEGRFFSHFLSVVD